MRTSSRLDTFSFPKKWSVVRIGSTDYGFKLGFVFCVT